METTVITISYNDLRKFTVEEDSQNNSIIIDKIGKAFGREHPESLGILAVTDVPTLAEKRLRLLPLARKIALLPDKTEIISEESNFQSGWSHGKEIFAGKPDLAKGSFYANPLVDDITTIRTNIPKSLQEANPGFFAPNVWPTQSMPEFQSAFKELGKLVVDVGRLVAQPCDYYVSQRCAGYSPKKLSNLLQESNYCKGRLLHYFPLEKSKNRENDSNDFSSWCGWHNDHGSLTGLIPGLYLDENGQSTSTAGNDKSGLYIQARNGSIHHVVLPENSIGFQIGETSQIHSGGTLQATPHAVRGSTDGAVTRESFAVFMEPEYHGDMTLPLDKTVEDIQDASITLPSSVKTLSSRWKKGMNFGEFSAATFSAFY